MSSFEHFDRLEGGHFSGRAHHAAARVAPAAAEQQILDWGGGGAWAERASRAHCEQLVQRESAVENILRYSDER